MLRRDFLALGAASLAGSRLRGAAGERHLIYVAEPGIRNYEQFGGVGVLVFDASAGHTFVRRIPTWTVPAGEPLENVKGVAAHAASGRLYVSTIRRIGCIDLSNDRMVWSVEPDGGCDRMALSPDGKTLYVPSFEGPHWNVIDASTGAARTKIVTSAGAHNTLFSADGRWVYLAGLRSPLLTVVDARTRTVARTVGPFGNVIRPFTVNAAGTLCYVNVNDLLGFEIGDMRTGRRLHRVEITGVEKGPVARHGCPSHGIGLTPDGRELWVADGHNSLMHVFDNTVMPPTPVAKLPLREQPGWITFSIDGRYAYPSSGEVFETATRRTVASLSDEAGRKVGSEKLLEVVFDGAKPVRAGDQFGVDIGRGRDA
jgi:hypothetical protein